VKPSHCGVILWREVASMQLYPGKLMRDPIPDDVRLLMALNSLNNNIRRAAAIEHFLLPPRLQGYRSTPVIIASELFLIGDFI